MFIVTVPDIIFCSLGLTFCLFVLYEYVRSKWTKSS